MLSFTPTQLAMLALLFVAGWLFGLASHPGGRKWRERYATERDAHAAHRKDADVQLAEANKRNAELERDNARLAKAAPVTAATVAPVTTERSLRRADTAPVARTDAVPVARTTARPAYADDGVRRGWFQFPERR